MIFPENRFLYEADGKTSEPAKGAAEAIVTKVAGDQKVAANFLTDLVRGGAGESGTGNHLALMAVLANGRAGFQAIVDAALKIETDKPPTA